MWTWEKMIQTLKNLQKRRNFSNSEHKSGVLVDCWLIHLPPFQHFISLKWQRDDNNNMWQKAGTKKFEAIKSLEKIHLAFLSQCCHEVQCDKQKQVWEREKIWEIELFETWQIFSNEYLKQIRKFWQFEENSSIQESFENWALSLDCFLRKMEQSRDLFSLPSSIFKSQWLDSNPVGWSDRFANLGMPHKLPLPVVLENVALKNSPFPVSFSLFPSF